MSWMFEVMACHWFNTKPLLKHQAISNHSADKMIRYSLYWTSFVLKYYIHITLGNKIIFWQNIPSCLKVYRTFNNPHWNLNENVKLWYKTKYIWRYYVQNVHFIQAPRCLSWYFYQSRVFDSFLSDIFFAKSRFPFHVLQIWFPPYVIKHNFCPWMYVSVPPDSSRILFMSVVFLTTRYWRFCTNLWWY